MTRTIESEQTCSFSVPECRLNWAPSAKRWTDSTGLNSFHCARAVAAHQSTQLNAAAEKSDCCLCNVSFVRAAAGVLD